MAHAEGMQEGSGNGPAVGGCGRGSMHQRANRARLAAGRPADVERRNVPFADASDFELVLAFQAGHRQVFDLLVARHQGGLRRFCQQRLAGDWAAAEEVVQDALVKAYMSLHGLEGDRRFGPWLRVIASRQCVDFLRKHGRVRPIDPVHLPDQVHEGPHDLLVDERVYAASTVREALARISPRHREVLRLSIMQGLPREDVAARLSIPMSTLEPLLSRARAAIRREVLL